jgi:NADH-quinone oxidoreductase subunit L
MAIALVLLAVGSIVAGFVGVPHALGGSNALGEWLAPVVGSHAPAEGAGGIAAMTIGGECVSATDAAAGQLPGMTLENCAPAADVARAANIVSQPPATTEQAPPTAAEAGQAEEAADEHAKEALELRLMALSSAVALLGVLLASFIWLKRPEIAANMAARFSGLYRLLLNKYYVDELYDRTIVQPVKIASEDGLWRGMDVRVVDGAVNGTGQIVGGMSAVMRLFQTGSVKTYAASTFLGVVLILAYYIWR